MFKKYFTKALLYNVLIAIGIIIVLLLLVQSGLKTYTRHGESITVRDLRGMTMEQVKTVLSDNNLKWQIMDSVFVVDKPPLAIIDQNPKPGSKVKQGRTIYLVVNATQAPTVEVPDLVGRSSYKYAKMQLESYGLKVADPVYQPSPHLNAVLGMTINGQNAKPKMKVPKGTIVTLILGDGLGNSRIPVPYLIGLRYDEAEFKLKGYSLNVGAVVVDDGVVDTMGAIVYKQVPEYGSGNLIRIGEPVDIFLGDSLPAGIVVHPELYDATDSTATQ